MSDLSPWQEIFTPDAAGNLTATAPGNRLTRAGDTRYEEDDYGNRILEVTGSEEQHYGWDTEHRLTGYRCVVRGQETARYRYRYDALGRRILKEDVRTGSARRFFWQGERLLCECDAATFWPGRLPDIPQLQETLCDGSQRVWLYEEENDFRPLAMLCGRQAQPEVYHYVCDHLGTPLELRDVRGRAVWSAMLYSYGQVHHADTAGINQPLRFQGQYHDGESGLYYNRHRYYDPGVGRYLSPDPVGLDGGLNQYAYVSNPLNYIDPLGLAGCDLTGNNWKFNSQKDIDLRGTGKTYRDALEEAFKRTGIPREQFEITKWERDQYGKSIPVEWQGPGGANVNMDIPDWNNVKSNGALGEGPHAPHIGYQTPGKPRTRGHIFIDLVPATRL